ncbi:MAG: DUF3467 domain-containing protein [Thermoleophilaceae bacterium]|nr:DUF3467 domain-containing protein [Thermoleophilaceae bacterium]
MADQEPEAFNMHADPETIAGQYANLVNVSHSDYEFTLTFARIDHEALAEGQDVSGVMVSRINLSHRCMGELVEAIKDNYAKWETGENIRDLPEYRGEPGDAPDPPA